MKISVDNKFNLQLKFYLIKISVDNYLDLDPNDLDLSLNYFN